MRKIEIEDGSEKYFDHLIEIELPIPQNTEEKELIVSTKEEENAPYF